ncbi:FecCD family ABC transporter permease [Alkalihalobacillus sp. 1P02AB]|uniref:FecCD family ABC transporter permease n=1 Tax=Alkalihalobacillus sp. 1P02AB TaxID=3132260 RepID=UPI0039A4D157
MVCFSSLSIGAKSMEWTTVFAIITNFDETNTNHQVIVQSRLPRLIGALVIGASLAVSGALMQGMTRNYLASPSIMGVSDGSVFMITILMIFLPTTSPLMMISSSLVGSAIGAGVVFGIASVIPGGYSPVRLAVLGTIIGTFLAGVSQALATYFQISQNISFWYNARLHQMDPTLLKWVLPFGLVGMLFALFLAKQVSLLSLGEEISVGLGLRIRLIKGLVFLAVVILTGISVALAGKIAFVGLAVPHIARFIVGQDYRKIIPSSALIGGLLLAFCDVVSRLINFPFETPVGVVTAIFGVPFLLYLIKTRGGKQRV